MSSKHNIRYKSAAAVPKWMRDNAKRGLAWVKEKKAGDGVTDKTIREAREMASGIVTVDKAMRMSAWFARHMVDLSSPDAKRGAGGFPSPGIVAHALWGGGSATDSRRAKAWAAAFAEKKYKQLGGDGSPPNYKVLLITNKHLGNLHNELSHGTWSKGSVSWGLAGQVRRRLGDDLDGGAVQGGGGKLKLKKVGGGGTGSSGGGTGSSGGGTGSTSGSTARPSPLNTGTWSAKDLDADRNITRPDGSTGTLRRATQPERSEDITSMALTTHNKRRENLSRALNTETGRRIGAVDKKAHSARIKADFKKYVAELEKIPTVKVLTKKFGEGGSEWGPEPTFTVQYKGNGEARRVSAKFARGGTDVLGQRGNPQDAMFVMKTVPHSFKSRNWYQSDAAPRITIKTKYVTLQEKAAIESGLTKAGIGGWTWSTQNGQSVLRLDWVEKYANGQTTTQWMKAANSAPAIVAQAQQFFGVKTVRESVSTETWGEKDYTKIVKAKTTQQVTDGEFMDTYPIE